MPMSKDPQKGGTEKDGSKNNKYCSYCYQNGGFTSPEIDTPQKMQSFCIEKMKEQVMPKIYCMDIYSWNSKIRKMEIIKSFEK